jgi:hypothetical protein
MDHQRPATQTLDQPSEAQTVECDAAEPAPESAGIRLGSRRYRPRAVSVVGARLQTRKRRRGRWRLLLPALVLALAIALAACGSSSSSSSSSVSAAVSSSATSSIKLAKTKFALHAGLAFGAFHRWIYKPVKAGTLTHPLSHKVTLVKAGLAAAFVYHELGLALKNAQADPTLSKVVAPVTALQAKLRGMPNTLKSGTTNPADVTDSNDLISSISQQSSSAGQPISEQVPTSLSTAGTT